MRAIATGVILFRKLVFEEKTRAQNILKQERKGHDFSTFSRSLERKKCTTTAIGEEKGCISGG